MHKAWCIHANPQAKVTRGLTLAVRAPDQKIHLPCGAFLTGKRLIRPTKVFNACAICLCAHIPPSLHPGGLPCHFKPEYKRFLLKRDPAQQRHAGAPVPHVPLQVMSLRFRNGLRHPFPFPSHYQRAAKVPRCLSCVVHVEEAFQGYRVGRFLTWRKRS